MTVIPDRAEDLIPKSEYEQIIDYFFPKIMVNPEDLLFPPIWIERPLKRS